MTFKTNLTRWDCFKAYFDIYPNKIKFWIKLSLMVWVILFLDALRRFGFPTIDIFDIIAGLILSFRFTIKSVLPLIPIGLIFVVATGGFYGGLGKHEFELRDEGLYIATSQDEITTKWEAIESLVKTKRFIYIHTNKTNNLVPRNSFDRPEEFDELWAALDEKCNA